MRSTRAALILGMLLTTAAPAAVQAQEVPIPPHTPGTQPRDNDAIDAAIRAQEAAQAACNRTAWEAARDRAIAEIERQLETEQNRALRLRLNQLKKDLRRYGFRPCDPPPPAPPPIEVVPPTGTPVPPPDAPPPDPRAGEGLDLGGLELAMEFAIARCDRDTFARARDASIAEIERRLETELDARVRTRLNMQKNELRRRQFPEPCVTQTRRLREIFLGVFYGSSYLAQVGTGVQRAGPVGTEEFYADDGIDRIDGYGLAAEIGLSRLTVGGGYEVAEGEEAFTTNAGPTGGSGVPFGRTSDIGTTGFFVPAESSGTTEVEFESWYAEIMYELFGDDEEEDDFDPEDDAPSWLWTGRFVVRGYVRYQQDQTTHRSSIGASGVTGGGTAFSYSQDRVQDVDQSNIELGVDFSTRIPLSRDLALGLSGRAGGYRYDASMNSFENDRASFGPPETRNFNQTNVDEADGFAFAGRAQAELQFKLAAEVSASIVARFNYRSVDMAVRNPIDGDEVLAGGRTRLEEADRYNAFLGAAFHLRF